jgi:hypothetical protein
MYHAVNDLTLQLTMTYEYPCHKGLKSSGHSGATSVNECLAKMYCVPRQTVHLEMWPMISSMLVIGLTVYSASAPAASQKDLSVRTPCLHTSELEHCMKGTSWNSSKQEPEIIEFS